MSGLTRDTKMPREGDLVQVPGSILAVSGKRCTGGGDMDGGEKEKVVGDTVNPGWWGNKVSA